MKLISLVNAVIWGAPALILILGVGTYLSFRLEFPQITLFFQALRAFFRKLFPGKDDAQKSSFRALCTALGATVGTGNLVGVAGAICLGGPGAIFWMWVCGFLGMGTKFAEATLAVRYRVKTEQGFVGGPMYVITQGLGEKFRPLAAAYSLFGMVAAFGVGNATQINAVVSGIHDLLRHYGGRENRALDLILGLILAVTVGSMLLGGAKRIGAAAEALVPVLALGYILLCGGVLIARGSYIPGAFAAIFQGAFSPKAVTGGMLGSAFRALRIGCSRGVFTNEAGMGTASIAHASADVSHPTEQGLMGIMEVFLDTILICTLTALVILVSGVPIPYGVDAAGDLTTAAFAVVYGRAASVFIAIALTCFAIATVLGWGLYGGRCGEFLFGGKAWRYFAYAQMAGVMLGAVLETQLVWQLSELFNGLMAIPNLLTLAVLAPELRRLTLERKSETHYADFH